MKSLKIAATTLALSLSFGLNTAQAFGLGDALSIAGVGSSNSNNSADNNNIVVNARNTLYSFAKAEAGLAAAMGGYEELASQQKLLEGMKAGDSNPSKDEVATLVNIHKSASEAINKKMAENAKLDANNKKLAASSMVEYVKGLVSSKKLATSVQGITQNPIALGQNAGAVIYMAKELPSIVSGGASTTTALFKYLGASGVDLSDAKKQAKDLGV